MKSPETMSRNELEDEVAFLRSELGLQVEDSAVANLCAAFKLTQMEARTLLLLQSVGGRVVTPVFWSEAVEPYRRAGGDGVRDLAVYIVRIRRRLGKAAIHNAWGKGYSITAVGQQLIEQARGAA